MFVRSTVLALSFVMPTGILVLAASPAPTHSKVTHKAVAANAGPDRFAREIAPIVKQYCLTCHSGSGAAGGINLSKFQDTASVVKARDVWERVAENVGSSHMPPDGAPAPSQAQRAFMVDWIQSATSTADCKIQDPGRVTMRRLNREEYNNTIRDLIGLDLRPADEFPSDDVGYGFDNIGDVLSISPLLMEKYLAAAEKVAQAAIVLPDAKPKPARFDGPKIPDSSGASFASTNARILMKNGEFGFDYAFPKNGDYIVRTRAFGRKADGEAAHLILRVDGKDLKTFDVTAQESSPADYETQMAAQAGKHRLSFAFDNDTAKSIDEEKKPRHRLLGIHYIEIVGPIGQPPVLTESHKRIVIAQPASSTLLAKENAARKVFSAFARRAYRRPVTPAEVERLVKYVDLAANNGESFERGIQLGVEAALVSPNFLFRVEVDPNPKDRTPHAISDYELASRLSYFLWSSMPDDTLFTLAAQHKLQKPTVLAAQVKRMLQDPKAQSLGEDFAGQWLTLRNLANVAPDSARFPMFDDKLRSSMRTETTMFFDAVVKEDRSVLDFIDGKFTYLNEPLAKIYGIDGVKGDEFRRVALTGDQRGGILTQASILTVTSNPTRTSPVKRGKWVLEQILGTPLPPPPPGVPQLPDDKKEPLKGTLRQRMEQHRKNPVCASCHARMDPIGFGFENFDAIGRWRTQDGDSPVDASGTLPDGKTFSGPAQIKAILKSKKAQFVQCLSQKMLTYALGRGLEAYDKCALKDITKSVEKSNYRFSSLVTAVVESEPFRKRRGDGGLKS